VTVRLSKAWDPQYDTKRLSELRDSTEFAKDHPEVGRKWVLDTAGDYVGLRPELTAPAVLDGVFYAGDEPGEDDPPLLVVRRRFLRCLSQHMDGDDAESNGYRVEWWNANAKNAGDPEDKFAPGWQRVKWPFSVLEHECGIYFDGDTPPDKLWALIYSDNADDAMVRITATIVGDRRLKGDATRQDGSANKSDITMTLDVSDRFQDSRIDESTNYGSIFAANPTEARNDTEAIQAYAEEVRETTDSLRLDMSLPIEGAYHPEFQIGDVIEKVSGRNIRLLLASGRYPQVVGIVHHCQGQQVELLMESFRKERPRIITGKMEKPQDEPRMFIERDLRDIALAKGIRNPRRPLRG
jgi:hypothetical protein